MRSGIIQHLPIADYHADPALSKSGLKLLLEKTPAHYFYQYRNPAAVKPETKGKKKFGQLLHDYVLEPELFKKLYVIAPPINKNKLVFKEMKKEIERCGKTLVDAKDMDALAEMAHALHAHPDAKGFLPKTNPEVQVETSYFWTDPATGLRCKCRTDTRIPSLRKPGDLKSCRSAKEEDFARDIMNYGYDIQDASYTSGMNTMLDTEVEDFTFICIESEPPYLIALWTLPAVYKRRGYAEYRRGLEIAAACEKAGKWHGYHEGVRSITPPPRVLREYEFEQEEEDDNEPEEYSKAS